MLVAYRWVVVRLRGEPLRHGVRAPWVMFDADGVAYGDGGCTGFFGSWRVRRDGNVSVRVVRAEAGVSEVVGETSHPVSCDGLPVPSSRAVLEALRAGLHVRGVTLVTRDGTVLRRHARPAPAPRPASAALRAAEPYLGMRVDRLFAMPGRGERWQLDRWESTYYAELEMLVCGKHALQVTDGVVTSDTDDYPCTAITPAALQGAPAVSAP